MERIFYLSTDADLENIVERVVKRLTDQPETESKDKLLTTTEVMEMFQVSKPTLHRWRMNGVVPSIKLGGSFRYRESDIQKVIEKQLTIKL